MSDLNICPDCDTPRVEGQHGMVVCVENLRAELAGWQTTAQQYEEIVRTTEAELERITTERDAAMKVVTDLDDWLNDCAYGRDDVVAGEDSHARLWDIREAYRVATSGQERCECVPAVDEGGAPDGYEYVCNLHEKASERDASDA